MADCPNIVKGEKRREKSHFHLLLSLSSLFSEASPYGCCQHSGDGASCDRVCPEASQGDFTTAACFGTDEKDVAAADGRRGKEYVGERCIQATPRPPFLLKANMSFLPSLRERRKRRRMHLPPRLPTFFLCCTSSIRSIGAHVKGGGGEDGVRGWPRKRRRRRRRRPPR